MFIIFDLEKLMDLEKLIGLEKLFYSSFTFH
jgi:hypothetical protein